MCTTTSISLQEDFASKHRTSLQVKRDSSLICQSDWIITENPPGITKAHINSTKQVRIKSENNFIFIDKTLTVGNPHDHDSCKELPLNAVVFVFNNDSIATHELNYSSFNNAIERMCGRGFGAFMLLQMQATAFILKECSASSPQVQAQSTTNYSSGQKLRKIFKGNQMSQPSKGDSDSPFMKLFCTSELKMQKLQHNDSLTLKNYRKLQKKPFNSKVFKYENTSVDCLNASGYLSNILTWRHQSAETNSSSVDCYAVLCDDYLHAKQLRRSLTQNIEEDKRRKLLETF